MSDLTEPLNSGVKAPKKTSIIPIWITLGVFLIAAAVSGTFTYIFTKEHFKPSRNYNPNDVFVPAERYHVSATMRMPYLGDFKQTIQAQVDTTVNKMKVDYFSGANTFIYDGAENSQNIAILPSFDKFACFTTSHNETLELPSMFPVLDNFKRADSRETITVDGQDILCDVWEYTHKMIVDTGSYTYLVPDVDGFAGEYKFYVNSETGKPVSFHIVGQNVILGGSHMDTYIFDYTHYSELNEIPATTFERPLGLVCTETDTPYGPTLYKSKQLSNVMNAPESHQKFVALALSHGVSLRTEEYNERYANFMKAENLIVHAELLSSTTQQPRKYTLAHNKFSFATNKELALYKGRRRTMKQTVGDDVLETACTDYTVPTSELPRSVDWIAQGKVDLTMNNQGTCGSCFTMSIAAAIESAIAIKRNTAEVTPVSVQQLMDCSTDEGIKNNIHYGGNQACSGGLDINVLSYLLLNDPRVVKASDYGMPGQAYLNTANFCHFYGKNTVNPFTGKDIPEFAVVDSCLHANTAWNGSDVPQKERVESLLHALNEFGPVSVSIAVTDDFYLFEGGVYDNVECSNNVDDADHSVVATGYSIEDNGEIYVTIRNSWSDQWGAKSQVPGTARILVKTAQGEYVNVCGVATVPVIPIIKA